MLDSSCLLCIALKTCLAKKVYQSGIVYSLVVYDKSPIDLWLYILCSDVEGGVILR